MSENPPVVCSPCIQNQSCDQLRPGDKISRSGVFLYRMCLIHSAGKNQSPDSVFRKSIIITASEGRNDIPCQAEVCRDQYFLKEMCKPAIHWPEADRPGPQYYDWTADSFYWISEKEWREKIENSYTSRISHNLQDYETRTNEVTGQLEVKWVVRRHTFDWTNEKHVRAFMSCWQSIYDAMFDHLDTYGYTLLLDFDRYREMAHLSPDRDFLLQCRIKQVPYPTMMRELQEKLGVSYKESNIAVIVNKEIPKKIAKAALRHALLIDTPQEERKQCFHCKQWLPRHDIFFAHNITRKDGLSSNCKECERIMRQQRKEQQDKWIKAAVEANAREHASVASNPNP